MLMAPRLTKNLLTLADAYIGATGNTAATLSKKAHSDSAFFERLMDGKISFSVRKYDEMVVWFRRNWPQGVPWPSGIAIPTRSEMRIHPPRRKSDGEEE